MAGDWIKIEHSLPSKPEVMILAEDLVISEFEVVGHLVLFWTWVDQNMSPDCPVVIGTKKGLDRAAGRDGFVDAMVKVGWLSFEKGSIQIPNYDYHLSKSAKSRAVESKKKQRQRRKTEEKEDAKSPDGVPESVPVSVPIATGQDRDQRREEKRRDLKEKQKGSNDAVCSYLGDEEFNQLWESFKAMVAQTHNYAVEAIQEQFQLSELERMPIGEAKEAIRFSISKGAKSPIVNGDHRRRKPQSAKTEMEISM